MINYDRGVSASFVLATDAPYIYNKVLRGDFFLWGSACGFNIFVTFA